MARKHETPCPQCPHTLTDHYLAPGTEINTAREAYLCHCGCRRTADQLAVSMPKSSGIRRVGHHWDYA
jgi:hypothetical protein